MNIHTYLNSIYFTMPRIANTVNFGALSKFGGWNQVNFGFLFGALLFVHNSPTDILPLTVDTSICS